MVSGFLTSPWLHVRMSSAVARPILSWSKKFTSSTMAATLRSTEKKVSRGSEAGAPRGAPDLSDLFDRAGLAAGQVDAELLGGAEDVLLRVTELDLRAVLAEHL